MRFTKKDEGLPQIMVIPMIDIMFFLLVFFMLATINMSNSGSLPIKLASMQNLQQTKLDGLHVAVDKDNKLYVDNMEIKADKLLPLLQKATAANPEMLVILRIDKNSQFYSTSELINILKRAGVKRIALAAEKRS
ncbi:biopolymer transporter ExbD [Phascolarctobacterium sp.]|uniref:ExbD/TolR family protein n=1 Tax=Phascolarctobacterium sp. TaxID=2049039 RepID=UPI002A833340|nr:biopolymer transporter ExbD [Phascolarctobacterium sp.]MDY5044739.1 biopolymer transporter ExbD [Phascolarctobacterium sp.]